MHIWEESGFIFSVYSDQVVTDSNKVATEPSLLKAGGKKVVLNFSSYTVCTNFLIRKISAELIALCQYLTCNGETKTVYSSWDAVWQMPKRGEELIPQAAGYALIDTFKDVVCLFCCKFDLC